MWEHREKTRCYSNRFRASVIHSGIRGVAYVPYIHRLSPATCF